MYSSHKLLFLRALTPLHMGVGRAEKTYVDLPIQRDEYGFPTIWSSSLKGAIKANLEDNLRKYLGSEPGEVETTPSSIAFLDAKLVFTPVRLLKEIWGFATTEHSLMNYLKQYLEISKKGSIELDETILKALGEGKAIVSKDSLLINDTIFVNEYTLKALANTKITELIKPLPGEIKDLISRYGLIVLPDSNGISLNLINRSIMIQYRVRLKRGTKTVEAGPWSEEYLPMNSVLVSVILCRDSNDKTAEELCNEIGNKLDNYSMFIGGKETIGKGIVKIYVL